jgi:hypothetical protein
VITVTVTGDDLLIAQLDRACSRAVPETMVVVTAAAERVRADWAQRWSGMAHAPALPAAVTKDVFPLPGSVRAEIGPDKSRRQGALGNLLEFGSVHNAPRPGGLPALQAEEPRLEAALEALSASLLGGP